MPADKQQLVLRLRNCLQTILELEEALSCSHLGPALAEEMKTLRQAFSHIDGVRVLEDDVCRIEAATGKFLAEIQEPLGTGLQTRKDPLRLLQ